VQPTYITISKLFSGDTRHTVPLFQRLYVWSREEQWEPLWEDIEGLLARLEVRDGDTSIASHFLGTVVLEQVQNPTGTLPRREVIDGQQRLTTLQIVLKAAEHALEQAQQAVATEFQSKVKIARRQIANLIENVAEGEEQYKVWPTNEDRAPFRQVMDAADPSELEHVGTRMASAYRYFHEQFSIYLLTGATERRAQFLAEALKDYLKVIVLDLEKSDEPQAIFETLNAHGTPLLPADLIKNWLLWEAARQRLDVASLYESYWREFDRDHEYWRAKIGTGHAARPRVDTFLQNWLTKETNEAISAKRLYDLFLKYVAGIRTGEGSGSIDVAKLMASIKLDAARYRRIDRPTDATRFDIFLERLKAMDVVVFHPLVLSLIELAGDDSHDLDSAGIVLESYLIRRMVCGGQTRGYGTLALSLMRDVKTRPDDASLADTLRGRLLGEANTDAWPDDDTFKSEWGRRKFYGALRRDRVLMVLRALERRYQEQAHLAEPLMTFDWSKLQVEHILPQSWETGWPISENVSPEDRNWALHGIGNLTLVSEKLNPTMSNSPWIDPAGKVGKQEALRKHTRLEINRRLLEIYPIWNDDAIEARGREMLTDALAIWPR
jgi:hypothetical protein